jgi:hypothetical protein
MEVRKKLKGVYVADLMSQAQKIKMRMFAVG